MPQKLNFYLDDRGFYRSDTTDRLQIVAGYFVHDIQGDLKSAYRLKKECKEVLNGKRNYRQGTGNVHTLTFRGTEAEIFNEKSITISVEDFLAHLEEWIEFVERQKEKRRKKPMLTKSLQLIDQADFDIFKLPCATTEEIAETEQKMAKNIPDELKTFYLNVSNGMDFGRLKILLIFSDRNKKKIADSIERHNSSEHRIWFNEDEKSINEFLVFCVENTHTCFAFKKNSSFVWQWNRGDSQVLELDYVFWDWLYESLQQEQLFFKDNQ